MPATPTEPRQPVQGYPLPLRLPGRDLVLWWGPDTLGTDRVAVENGRPLVWSTIESCLDDIRRRGLEPANDAQDDEPEIVDLRPVVAWLRDERLTLDPIAALNLWNLAGDVAVSVDAAWDDAGLVADSCHAKLTATAVPWLAGVEHYSPRWSPRELRYLRTRLLAANGLLQRWLT